MIDASGPTAAHAEVTHAEHREVCERRVAAYALLLLELRVAGRLPSFDKVFLLCFADDFPARCQMRVDMSGSVAFRTRFLLVVTEPPVQVFGLADITR